MPVPSLLAVFAHPDDESLSAGGVLARHASAGARTAVVTPTWSPDTPRAGELAEALRVLGAGPPRMLGYADSRVPHSAPGRPRWCDAPLDEAVGELVARIRDFRPEIVVTHDAYGGPTGHEDHVHTHRVTALAVHAAGLERLHPEAGEPWQPKALYLSTHLHKAVRTWGAHLALAGKALFTVPDEYVSAAVDVTPWLDRKITAILAHRTEVTRGAAPALIAALSPLERQHLLGTEHYTRHDVPPTACAQTELLP
ncbi:PIG-L deacetylase family protein [Streptomyces sp. NPDC059696]|uniref:PIG-L deacetylase family protein n=1 Tax=Streptomyces sp. NPDC059696 TaxID=3346911 RepID=UPI0036CBF714